MSRYRNLVIAAFMVAAAVVLFVLFIGFRHDTALVGALSAAGTVVATGFAAVAAMGSMRAAAESSATARRSHEAMARTVQPRVAPGLRAADGVGEVRCTGSRPAIDVTVAWIPVDGTAVPAKVALLEPDGKDVLASDLPGPIRMVWIDYWDDRRVGHWQDTWEAETEKGATQPFRRTDSRLLD
ncbi:MAG TPA: hypothetical protein VF062_23795 [Candidatus Limnocylindrales bacterium]